MRYHLFIIINFFVFIAVDEQAFSNNKCRHTETKFNCVEYIDNFDADTVKFNIPGAHPIIGNKINIRVNGIDSAKLRTKSNCEKMIAKSGKRFVANILKNSKRIDLENVKRGKYFRIVADVLVDGKLLSKMILDKKYAVEYDGGKKSKVNWCDYTKQSLSH